MNVFWVICLTAYPLFMGFFYYRKLFICKYLIVIIKIVSMFHCLFSFIFYDALFNSSEIICQYTMIQCQAFVCHTNTAHSTGPVERTECITARVLGKILKNPVLEFGECRIPEHCHSYPVHSVKIPSMDQIRNNFLNMKPFNKLLMLNWC